MAFEVKQAKSTEQKIAERLRPSGGDAQHHTVHGSGPTRTHHFVHDFGAKNDGTGGAKPTAGTVAINNETRVPGGEAAKLGSGDRSRRGWPHSGGDAA